MTRTALKSSEWPVNQTSFDPQSQEVFKRVIVQAIYIGIFVIAANIETE